MQIEMQLDGCKPWPKFAENTSGGFNNVFGWFQSAHGVYETLSDLRTTDELMQQILRKAV